MMINGNNIDNSIITDPEDDRFIIRMITLLGLTYADLSLTMKRHFVRVEK